MRTCSECGTQYEDHVESCLLDGTTLDPPETTATPAPAPIASSAPAKAAGGGLLLGVLAVVLFGVIAVVGVGIFLFAGGDSPPPEPVAVAPVPPPAPPSPAPTPPPAPTVKTVALVSSPPGARVTEHDAEVCVTPCNIEHPEDAPLPRTFHLELDGHKPADFVMTEAAGPFLIELEPIRAATSPRPARPVPAPTPDPGPRPVPTAPRPSLTRDR